MCCALPSAHASSNPLPCSSFSLYGCRHMSRMCCALPSAHASSNPLLRSSFSLYGCRHMSRMCCVLHASVRSCQLKSAALQLLFAVWLPPYVPHVLRAAPFRPLMPAQIRCFAAPFRCMAAAICRYKVLPACGPARAAQKPYIGACAD